MGFAKNQSHHVAGSGSGSGRRCHHRRRRGFTMSLRRRHHGASCVVLMYACVRLTTLTWYAVNKPADAGFARRAVPRRSGPVRGGCGATAARARSSAAAQQGPRRAMPQGSLDLCFQYCCSCGGQPLLACGASGLRRRALRLPTVSRCAGASLDHCAFVVAPTADRRGWRFARAPLCLRLRGFRRRSQASVDASRTNEMRAKASLASYFGVK